MRILLIGPVGMLQIYVCKRPKSVVSSCFNSSVELNIRACLLGCLPGREGT